MTHNAYRNAWMLVIGITLTVISLGVTASESAKGADAVNPPNRTHWMKTPCAEEDSVNCYWNARVQGDGRGHSFYVREFPGKAHMVCVMYVKPKDARRWDYCEANAPHS